jgi:hypothetical protein
MTSCRKTKKIRKRVYDEMLYDLVYELSLDSSWRRQLFTAARGKRILLNDENMERLDTQLSELARQSGRSHRRAPGYPRR